MAKLTVGLTGGIASGKSLVADQFIALGVPVLDADQVSRDVVSPPSPALDAISRHFGREFIDPGGGLDRRRMREHVFKNAGARRELEAILHPLISARLREWRDAQQVPYCILSVAILLESGMKALVDRILVVDTSVEDQLQRLTRRDGITIELARSMVAAQTSRETRLAAAHDVINNSADPAGVGSSVARLHAFYLEMAQSGRFSAPGLSLN